MHYKLHTLAYQHAGSHTSWITSVGVRTLLSWVKVVKANTAYKTSMIIELREGMAYPHNIVDNLEAVISHGHVGKVKVLSQRLIFDVRTCL